MANMRYQPQGRARVGQSSLSRGLVFATSDPLAPFSASGHAQTQQGSGFIRSITKDGRTVAAGADQTTTGVIVLPASVRDALIGKPVTIAWVSDGARTSGAAQAIYCHRDGSTQAFYIGVNTANVQFAVLGFSDVNLNPGNLASATRFVLTADGTTVTLYTDSQITTAAGVGLPATTTILPSILNRQTGGRGNSSNVANITTWNRALSAAEAAQWQANPWQIFDAPEDDDFIVAAATPSNSTGTLAATLAVPSMVSAGLVTVPSTLAATLAAPTFAASGIAATPPSGTFAASMPAPVMTSTGIALDAGSFSATMPAPSMSAIGTAAPNVSGTLAFTMPAPTMNTFGFLGGTAPAAPVRPYRWRILRRNFAPLQ